LKHELQLRNRNAKGGTCDLASRSDRLKCGFDWEETWGSPRYSNSLRNSLHSHEPRSVSAVFRPMLNHPGESPRMCGTVRSPLGNRGDGAVGGTSRKHWGYCSGSELYLDGAVWEALAAGIGAGWTGQRLGHPVATSRLDAV